MKEQPDRRDFLKLLSLIYLSGLGAHLLSPKASLQSSDERQNVIILVFDTLSALHISLYGYVRDTMPNLTKFADKATVYHSHFSAGNFTMPGTASILTGTYPWSHRGFHLRGSISGEFSSKNLFQLFRENQYTSFAFSQNMYVNMILSQFQQGIDFYSMPRKAPLVDHNLSDLLFSRDYATAIRSERSYLTYFGTPSNSLFLDTLSSIYRSHYTEELDKELERLFPRGVPQNEDIVCILEDTFDWLSHQLKELQRPYLAYIHLMPPHAPYRTRSEFVDVFNDGWKSIPKPEHIFTWNKSYEELNKLRREYDEYIAYADAEFGRFFNNLEREGILDDTWVIFTSDHGEMFERGIFEHNTETLYQPLLRVPLLISEPGQSVRKDIYKTTSSVDLLPTLSKLCGFNGPGWSEGITLPLYRELGEEKERNIYAVEAKSNPKVGPLRRATVAMMKEQYKIIKYWGYPEKEDFYEVFDLANDPEELDELSLSRKSLALELLRELELKVDDVNSDQAEQ